MMWNFDIRIPMPLWHSEDLNRKILTLKARYDLTLPNSHIIYSIQSPYRLSSFNNKWCFRHVVPIMPENVTGKFPATIPITKRETYRYKTFSDISLMYCGVTLWHGLLVRGYHHDIWIVIIISQIVNSYVIIWPLVIKRSGELSGIIFPSIDASLW